MNSRNRYSRFPTMPGTSSCRRRGRANQGEVGPTPTPPRAAGRVDLRASGSTLDGGGGPCTRGSVGTSTDNSNYNDFMHARPTVAQWGHFLSVDPNVHADKALNEPQRWNRYSYAANNPIRYVDPNGQEPLDPILLMFYNRFLGNDFSRVDIQSGFFFGGAITKPFGNAGMTIGNQVFLNSALDFPKTQFSLEVAGHELTHTVQFNTLGKTEFLVSYLMTYAIFKVPGGMSHDDAYNHIPYEVLANRAGSKLEDLFDAHPDILEKLENGEALTKTDWEEIDKYKPFKEGLQFIDGFLVYVAPKR